MTVSEIMEELYDQLGKQSDLNPYSDDEETTLDLGQPGAQKLLGWINRGYRRILNWRFKGGRIVRFRSTERQVYFSGVSETGTAAAGAASSITLAAAAPAIADWFNGWIVRITSGTGSGQKRLIVDYSAARVATVARAWDNTPDATSVYEITKNEYAFVAAGSATAAVNIPLSPTEQIIAVTGVVDLQDNSQLVRASRTARFTSVEDTAGNAPSLFRDTLGGIVFDSTVPDGRYYRLSYFGMPPALSALDDEPQIPEHFHEGILLWTVWWGLRRQQAFGDAYSTKRDLEDTMETALQQFDRGSEREELTLYLEDRYE